MIFPLGKWKVERISSWCWWVNWKYEYKAKIISESLGKINDLSVSEQSKLYEQVSLAALKYHILKVDPKKSILFDPNESIDFNGILDHLFNIPMQE